MTYLDTQVVVWIAEARLDRLSAAAKDALEASGLLISPMVLLELGYLYEIGRLRRSPASVYQQLEAQLELRICGHPFASVMEAALLEGWTRDPFDRIIVAHAKSNGYCGLVTSDDRVREHYSRAVW